MRINCPQNKLILLNNHSMISSITNSMNKNGYAIECIGDSDITSGICECWNEEFTVILRNHGYTGGEINRYFQKEINGQVEFVYSIYDTEWHTREKMFNVLNKVCK